MNALIDILISISVIGILVFFAAIAFVIMSQTKDIFKSNNGIFLIDIDLKNNRLKKSDIIETISADIPKNIGQEFFDDGWMDISVFLSNLTEKNREIFLNALDLIKINKKYVKFVIKNETTKDPDCYIEWIIELFQANKEISATIKWSYVKKIPNGLKIISKEGLYENNTEYQSFIAFNLNDKDQRNFQNFIITLFESLKIKNLNFFVWKNIVILIIYGDNNEIVQTKTKKIIKKFEKIRETKNLNAYFDSVAVVESKNLSDSNDFSKIINRIYFSLIKSSQLNKVFYFNAKNIFFNEFEEFKENFSILIDIIKNKKIKTKEISIFNFKNNNVIATYVKPEIEYTHNFWTDMIFKNKNILPNTDDEYFNNVLKLFKKTDQYLIDVNDYNVLENIDQMEKLKSIVFIIKLDASSNIQNFELITFALKSKGIKFGIKIEKIVPETITIIELIMPHAIIINESLVDDKDLRKFLNLKQLIVLCNKNPATLIFENPSEIELLNNKINYYYKNS